MEVFKLFIELGSLKHTYWYETEDYFLQLSPLTRYLDEFSCNSFISQPNPIAIAAVFNS